MSSRRSTYIDPRPLPKSGLRRELEKLGQTRTFTATHASSASSTASALPQRIIQTHVARTDEMSSPLAHSGRAPPWEEKSDGLGGRFRGMTQDEVDEFHGPTSPQIPVHGGKYRDSPDRARENHRPPSQQSPRTPSQGGQGSPHSPKRTQRSLGQDKERSLDQDGQRSSSQDNRRQHGQDQQHQTQGQSQKFEPQGGPSYPNQHGSPKKMTVQEVGQHVQSQLSAIERQIQGMAIFTEEARTNLTVSLRTLSQQLGEEQYRLYKDYQQAQQDRGKLRVEIADCKRQMQELIVDRNMRAEERDRLQLEVDALHLRSKDGEEKLSELEAKWTEIHTDLIEKIKAQEEQLRKLAPTDHGPGAHRRIIATPSDRDDVFSSPLTRYPPISYPTSLTDLGGRLLSREAREGLVHTSGKMGSFSSIRNGTSGRFEKLAMSSPISFLLPPNDHVSPTSGNVGYSSPPHPKLRHKRTMSITPSGSFQRLGESTTISQGDRDGTFQTSPHSSEDAERSQSLTSPTSGGSTRCTQSFKSPPSGANTGSSLCQSFKSPISGVSTGSPTSRGGAPGSGARPSTIGNLGSAGSSGAMVLHREDSDHALEDHFRDTFAGLFTLAEEWTKKYTSIPHQANHDSVAATNETLWSYMMNCAYPGHRQDSNAHVHALMGDINSKSWFIMRMIITYCARDLMVAEAFSVFSEEVRSMVSRYRNELAERGLANAKRQGLVNLLANTFQCVIQHPDYTEFRSSQLAYHTKRFRDMLGPLLNQDALRSDAGKDLGGITVHAWDITADMLASPVTFQIFFPETSSKFNASTMDAIDIAPDVSPMSLQSTQARLKLVITPVITMRDDRGTAIKVKNLHKATVLTMV